jgi:hypothetical protein
MGLMEPVITALVLLSYVQNLSTFCIHLQFLVFVQFSSCTTINYGTRDQHCHYIKNIIKRKLPVFQVKPDIVNMVGAT